MIDGRDGWTVAAWIGGGLVVFLAAVLLLHVAYGGAGSGATPLPETGTTVLGMAFDGNASTTGFAGAANATGVRYVDGVSGRAVRFDGETGAVTVPGTAALNLSMPFRIEAWVRAEPGRGQGYIVSRHDYDAARGYALVRTEADEIGFRVGNGTAWTGVYSEPVDDGRWHHVTAILHRDRLRLYIDGEAVDYTAELAGELVHTGGPLVLGRAQGYDGDRFAGDIDDLRVSSDTVEAVFGFDGTVADRSGHGYAVANGTWRFAEGVDGSALVLNRTELAVTPAIDPGGTFTVEAWVRPDAVDRKQHVVTTYDYDGPAGYLLAVTRDGKAEFRVGNGTAEAAVYSDGMNMSTWHHLAGTFDGRTARLYVDGEAVGYTEDVAGMRLPNGTTHIGGAGYGGDRFTGLLDTVRVSRQPLEPAGFHTPRPGQ